MLMNYNKSKMYFSYEIVLFIIIFSIATFFMSNQCVKDKWYLI